MVGRPRPFWLAWVARLGGAGWAIAGVAPAIARLPLDLGWPSHRNVPVERLTATDVAERTTVKVYAGREWGSGTPIARLGNDYWVLTNAHVLEFRDPETVAVETPDGQRYSARRESLSLDGFDLAVVKFASDRAYPTATIAPAPAAPNGEMVVAAGYPTDERSDRARNLHLTTGVLALHVDRPFNRGYQLGYTNAVPNGMSGGPLVNLCGDTIAVNGMHAYPIWGNPYEYADGSVASEAEYDLYEHYSWGIPLAGLTVEIEQQLGLQPGAIRVETGSCENARSGSRPEPELAESAPTFPILPIRLQ